MSDSTPQSPSSQRTERQKYVFTQYLNSLLPESLKIPSSDQLTESLSSGLLLLHILEALVKRHYNKEPHFVDHLNETATPNMYQKMENIRMVLNYLTNEEHIKSMVNMDAKTIVDGNEKLILGLVWRIIHHFHVSRQASRRASEEKEQVLEQATGGSDSNTDNQQVDKHVEVLRELTELEEQFSDILKWVNRTVQQQDSDQDAPKADNMTSSWSNAKLIQSLILSLASDDDTDAQTLRDMDPEANPEEVFQACIDYAHDKFGVPKMVTVEDFTNPDKMVISTYLAYIRDFALQKEKEQILKQNQLEEEEFENVIGGASEETQAEEESAPEEDQTAEETPQEEEEETSPEEQDETPAQEEEQSEQPQEETQQAEDNNQSGQFADDVPPMMKAQRDRQERINKASAEARKQHEAQLEEARKWKESVLQERSERIEKKHQINVDEEKRQREYMDESSDEFQNLWERVVKYCSFNHSTSSSDTQQVKDTQRMKKLLLQLKNDKTMGKPRSS